VNDEHARRRDASTNDRDDSGAYRGPGDRGNRRPAPPRATDQPAHRRVLDARHAADGGSRARVVLPCLVSVSSYQEVPPQISPFLHRTRGLYKTDATTAQPAKAGPQRGNHGDDLTSHTLWGLARALARWLNAGLLDALRFNRAHLGLRALQQARQARQAQ